MGRTLGFDRARVLESIERQFWTHGFRGTSTEDLCTTTGLGRSSLYNSFGTKLVVYTECLTAYLARANAGFEAIVRDEHRTALDRISALLDAVVDEELTRRAEGAPTGCLGVNTVVELADDPSCEPVVDQVNRDTRARQATLAACVRAGQASGDVSDALDAVAFAEFVNATIVGIRVVSRGGADAIVLRGIADAARRSLTPA